jgi:hypothetical protein
VLAGGVIISINSANTMVQKSLDDVSKKLNEAVNAKDFFKKR